MADRDALLLAFGRGPFHVERRTNACAEICDEHRKAVAECSWSLLAGDRANAICALLNDALGVVPSQAQSWEKWLRADHIKLHAGEMTAGELRAVQAVVRAMLAETAPGVSGSGKTTDGGPNES